MATTGAGVPGLSNNEAGRGLVPGWRGSRTGQLIAYPHRYAKQSDLNMATRWH